MISLSPLCTAHPPTFQRWWVRTSIPFYRNFILAMHRSPGFGSTPCYYYALFRLAFAPATPVFGLTLQQRSNSPDHYSIGTPSVHRPPKRAAFLRPLVSIRFQVLFHSPSGVLFTFPSRYYSAIGRQRVFSIGQWSAQVPTWFHVSRGTQVLIWRKHEFRLRGFHPLCRTVPGPSAIRLLYNSMVVP